MLRNRELFAAVKRVVERGRRRRNGGGVEDMVKRCLTLYVLAIITLVILADAFTS